MDAVTLIQNNLNVELLLSHYSFNHTQPDGDFIRSTCKIHEGDNPSAFVIHAETGLWYCHTGGCGGGDAFTLVQKIEGCEFKESVVILADLLGLDIENMQITERKEGYLRELKQWIHAMQSRRKKEADEFHITEEIRKVASFRNYKEETLDYFQLGWVEKVRLPKKDGSGHFTLNNRLVFPIKQNNRQVGISFRRIKKSDNPKWLHQPHSIQTNRLLYNYDNVLGKESVVVCEGMTDVWAYHELGIPAVATFGAHMTEEQYKLLMRTGADIILSYDGDEAGRIATQKAIELLKNKANLFIVEFSHSQDPDNVERNQLKLLYESRRRI